MSMTVLWDSPSFPPDQMTGTPQKLIIDEAGKFYTWLRSSLSGIVYQDMTFAAGATGLGQAFHPLRYPQTWQFYCSLFNPSLSGVEFEKTVALMLPGR